MHVWFKFPLSLCLFIPFKQQKMAWAAWNRNKIPSIAYTFYFVDIFCAKYDPKNCLDSSRIDYLLVHSLLLGQFWFGIIESSHSLWICMVMFLSSIKMYIWSEWMLVDGLFLKCVFRKTKSNISFENFFFRIHSRRIHNKE